MSAPSPPPPSDASAAASGACTPGTSPPSPPRLRVPPPRPGPLSALLSFAQRSWRHIAAVARAGALSAARERAQRREALLCWYRVARLRRIRRLCRMAAAWVRWALVLQRPPRPAGRPQRLLPPPGAPALPALPPQRSAAAHKPKMRLVPEGSGGPAQAQRAAEAAAAYWRQRALSAEGSLRGARGRCGRFERELADLEARAAAQGAAKQERLRADLEQARSRSEARVIELQGAVRRAGDEAAAAVQEAARLTAVLHDERAGFSDTRGQLLAELAALRAQMSRAAECASESLGAALRGGQAARDEAGRLRRERDEARSALDQKAAANRQLTADLLELRSRGAGLQAALERQRAERDALQGRERELQARGAGLAAELGQLRAVLEQQRAELASRQQDAARLSAQLAAARGELAAARSGRQTLEAALDRERATGYRLRGELGCILADLQYYTQLGAPLGAGGFGEVCSAELPLVVKRSQPGGELALRHEAAVLSALCAADCSRTEGIVAMLGTEPFGPPINGILLERCLGDLVHLRPRDLNEVVSWTEDLLRGLSHLSRNGVVHRDVKEANLLLTRDRGVVIADLGISRPAGSMAAGGWTLGWQPPEAVLLPGERETHPAEDWWAAALVITSLGLGEHPLRAADFDSAECLEEVRHLLRRGEQFAGETVAEHAPDLIHPATAPDFFDADLRVIDPERRCPRQGPRAGRWLERWEWEEAICGEWDRARPLLPVLQPRDIPDLRLRRVVQGMGRLDPRARMDPQGALAELR